MFDDNLSLVIFVLFAAITFTELLYYYVLYARFAFRRTQPCLISDRMHRPYRSLWW